MAGRPETDEEYEILDLSNINSNWIDQMSRRIMGDVSRQSAAKQFGVGSVTGMVAGWLFVKVGKVAAATVGTTVLLVQVAQHQGYIQINWNKVRSSVERAEREIKRTADRHYPGLVAKTKALVQENMFLVMGFSGGFLVGLAL